MFRSADACPNLPGMRTNGDHKADPTIDHTAVPTDALTVAEAAEALGITTEAARMRVKRGTLPSTRIEGTVYVLVDRPDPRPYGPNVGPNDQPNPRPNGSVGGPNGRPNGHADAGVPGASALLAAKDETIGDLREQLEAERQANRENRRIIAGLIERVPELPPASSQEPRDGYETSVDGSGGVEAPAYNGGTQTDTPRPWWRRLLGG